jgi:hypothetical protein
MTDDLRKLLAGYVDGELSEQERMEFERKLAEDPRLREELKEFSRLKEVTGMASYTDLPDEMWEGYWQSLYRKMERGFGWIFLSLGAIILLSLGLFELFQDVFLDPEVSLWVKFGVAGAGVGAIILLVSFVRERLFAFKHERYREVIR